MNKQRINKLLIVIFFGLLVVALPGCFSTKFTEPVVSFQQSINKSSFIIIDYYEKANEFEREIYLNECLFNPEKELLIQDNGKSTPLLHAILSPDSIKARADALVLFGIYANRLAELAGNEAPEVFRKGSIELGDNLKNLGKTFSNLSKDDTDAVLYSGPVSKIVGVLGEMYLIKSRNGAIENAVKIGYPAVNKILNQLQKDLNNIIIPLQKIGLKQKIAEMSIYYNENRKKLTLTRRKTELARINKVIVEYNELLSSNPANLIQEMKQTNNALGKYAETSGSPKDFAEFASVLDRFNRNLQLFAEGVK